MTQPPPPPTPPGWHPDRDDPTMLRWWDGRQWTDDWQLANSPTSRPGLGKSLLIIGGVVVVALVIVAAAAFAVVSTSNSENEESASVPIRTYTPDPSASAEASRRAEADRIRLSNKASYTTVTSREWQLVAKNPDAHIGELYVVYGRVVQADSATGTDQIRVYTDGQQVESFDFDINTLVTAGEASFVEVVQDDLVTLWVKVTGAESYQTTMGGDVTAPAVEANIVEVYGSAD